MCLTRLVNKIRSIMAKTDPNDFLLNTDYEMDKIIFFESGEFTSSVTITHGLDFIPLPFGVWSTDENFSSTNPLGWRDSSTEPGYTPTLSVECYANGTSIKLEAAGNTNNTKLYYRVYGFEPTDSRKNAPRTSAKAKQMILNTDYNYCKLLKFGTFASDNEEFSHNLGYIPQIMAWLKYDPALVGEDRIDLLDSSSDATNIGLKVTNNKLINRTMASGLIEKIYWRVYYDEA